MPSGAKFCLACGTPTAAPREKASPHPAPEPQTERSPSSYTPQHLADKILRSKSALEGERKQVTVMFADVASSMQLAEQLDPEAWHRGIPRDRLQGRRVAAFAYDPDFLEVRAPWVVAGLAFSIVLPAWVGIQGRWSATTRRVELVVNLYLSLVLPGSTR